MKKYNVVVALEDGTYMNSRGISADSKLEVLRILTESAFHKDSMAQAVSITILEKREFNE